MGWQDRASHNGEGHQIVLHSLHKADVNHDLGWRQRVRSNQGGEARAEVIDADL
jgi:hypothetical protein